MTTPRAEDENNLETKSRCTASEYFYSWDLEASPIAELTAYEVYRPSARRTLGIGVADLGDARVCRPWARVQANFDDQ